MLNYFEQSYGQFVLLKPENPFVWILPVVVLLLGIGIVIFKARRLTDNRELTTDNSYINRVRELVEKE
ncbi:MAG: hypothetical protein DMF59_19815 [Acidobacteria bacterium]|nr:MAG: hypothetical protein DMF59_19815 [Acidobacteriota bacterium]